MKKSRTPFYIFIGVLLTTGLVLTWYRHLVFEVPWLPGEKRQVWSVEAKVEFLAEDKPIIVSLAIPDSQPGFERLGEHTASPGYGLSFVDQNGGRRAEWSIRSASGRQTLYYRVDMLVDDSLDQESLAQKRGDADFGLTIPDIKNTDLLKGGPYATSAKQLLQRAMDRSADAYTLARELINEFNTQEEGAQFLEQNRSREEWLVALLNEAGVAARTVMSLRLEDGRRRQHLLPFIQVYEGDVYRLYDPRSGRQGREQNRLMWEYRSGSLLDLVGGSKSSVSFSVIDQEIPVSRMLELELERGGEARLDFSVHSLPLGEQAMFKGILLIPVGVLVVVFLRVFVGLRTSGTFMPVLIAMSFIQTSLITGIIGFILIVGVGLLIRSYLSQHNLLLVARISAVIIFVIVMIAGFSVIAFQLGLSEGLKITFFPMIILSWTIERMSILWEEEGPQEVLIQGGGSLTVALVAYMLMTNEFVRHLTFNFLGLQLIFVAIVLLIGNYTGYRLLEFRRFQALVQKI